LKAHGFPSCSSSSSPPVRETAIFLLPLTLAVAWTRNQRKQGLILAVLMLAAWIPFRSYILHCFAANPATEMALHLHENLFNIVNPSHWPQMLSAFGFLLLPLILGNRLLSPAQPPSCSRLCLA